MWNDSWAVLLLRRTGGIQSYYQLCGESISRKYDTWLQSVAQEARALLVFSGDQGLFDHIQLLSVSATRDGYNFKGRSILGEA